MPDEESQQEGFGDIEAWRAISCDQLLRGMQGTRPSVVDNHMLNLLKADIGTTHYLACPRLAIVASQCGRRPPPWAGSGNLCLAALALP